MTKSRSDNTRPRKRSTRGNQQEPAYTPAEQKRIRAHILARGMEFRVFLPEGMADWLRKKVRAGVFQSPSEAAFIAFQDLIELDKHPEARKTLLKAMLDVRINDPRPGIPAEKVFARIRARTRRYARTKPPRPKPLPKPLKRAKAAKW